MATGPLEGANVTRMAPPVTDLVEVHKNGPWWPLSSSLAEPMGSATVGEMLMRDGASNDIDATAAALAAVGQPALFGCDASGSITFADPAIGQLLGVDPSTLIGTCRVSDLLDASELAARAETLGVPV